MVIDIDKAMEHAFVLTDQPWQYGLFCKRMQAAGFENMPLEYSALTPVCLMPSRNTAERRKSVSATVYHIINAADSRGWDYVTIFEWDAYPMTDCRDRLVEFFAGNPLPDVAVSVALGNTRWIQSNGNHIRGVEGRYVLPNGLSGSHATIYPKSGYTRWIDGYAAIPAGDTCYVDEQHRISGACYATDRSFFIQVHDLPRLDKPWAEKQFKDFYGLDPDTGVAGDYEEAFASGNTHA